MAKLNLKVIQEIKEFCERFTELPLFFSVLHYKSTRDLYSHRFDTIKTELLTGERLRQFKEMGRLPKTLVFIIPQLNEFVTLMREADLTTWDETKEKWFCDSVLPCLRCPVEKITFTNPVIKLTIGLPEGILQDRYDLHLAHLFERNDSHQSTSNPFDPFNPFFPCVAKLPDEWDEMMVKAQRIEIEDPLGEPLANDWQSSLPPLEHAPLALVPAPAAHPTAVMPVWAQLPVPVVQRDGDRLWYYLLIRALVELFSCAPYFVFAQGQYNARIGRFPEDFTRQQLTFNQKLQDFLTKYPDCSAIFSNGEKLCAHACFDLFISALTVPSSISHSYFSRYAKSVNHEHYLGYFACSFFGVFFNLFPQLAYFDSHPYPEGHRSWFYQFNSWTASFKNKDFLLMEVGAFAFRSLIYFFISYMLGDDAAKRDINMPAFACALPASFRACKGMPRECYTLQDAPDVNNFLSHLLLQCGLFFGTLFLPKVVNWLYDDAPRVTRQVINSTRHLLGRPSRFFHSLLSREGPRTPKGEQHTNLAAHSS